MAAGANPAGVAAAGHDRPVCFSSCDGGLLHGRRDPHRRQPIEVLAWDTRSAVRVRLPDAGLHSTAPEPDGALHAAHGSADLRAALHAVKVEKGAARERRGETSSRKALLAFFGPYTVAP
jgi:hypothetical protein